ncbi:unnamed protein product [Rotaria sp. Silwood1]|nr:unnamed protein product [Rotaria sp. Silwood1]CAF1570751.1 unnamed protein product [Rotaria sp. Silwood1]
MEGVTDIMEHGLTGLKDEQWKNARSIVSPVFSTTKLKAMYGLMNEISDMYNKRLLEYADKQEIFDVKMLNGQYTLDNIASCLFALNDKEILGQALVFLVAGYETTSVLMSFFFYVMATEPVIQEKLYNEIRQELGKTNNSSLYLG